MVGEQFERAALFCCKSCLFLMVSPAFLSLLLWLDCLNYKK